MQCRQRLLDLQIRSRSACWAQREQCVTGPGTQSLSVCVVIELGIKDQGNVSLQRARVWRLSSPRSAASSHNTSISIPHCVVVCAAAARSLRAARRRRSSPCRRTSVRRWRSGRARATAATGWLRPRRRRRGWRGRPAARARRTPPASQAREPPSHVAHVGALVLWVKACPAVGAVSAARLALLQGCPGTCNRLS